MRQAFAHEAVLVMGDSGNIQAPGAAITAALCGQWEHPPPCPLAPHHTSAERSGAEVRLRILFAAEPAAEADVRDRIGEALSQGHLTGPEGFTTRWQFRDASPGTVRDDEAGHANQLINA